MESLSNEEINFLHGEFDKLRERFSNSEDTEKKQRPQKVPTDATLTTTMITRAVVNDPKNNATRGQSPTALPCSARRLTTMEVRIKAGKSMMAKMMPTPGNSTMAPMPTAASVMTSIKVSRLNENP